ncbi:hypothetical protein [Actinomadura fibrosa]|uniref:Uncharacterized protein n=1 Tax=Actinomadura fibrosa TaxID=111802 RepID=A0ABW2XPE8_9ACTN|nr:hypothetical protein [Actinomadura fibrosa]
MKVYFGDLQEGVRFAPLSGWYSEPFEDGFTARRLAGLSEYQLRNGCLDEVRAGDMGELWLLCDAQTRLAERVAVAESVRGRV